MADSHAYLQERELESNLLAAQSKIPLQERGFKSINALKSKTHKLIQYHRWEKFSTTLTKSVYLPIVQEFYSALKEVDTSRPIEVPWMMFFARGKEMTISPAEIVMYYDVPLYIYDFVQRTDLMFFPRENMNGIIKLLTDKTSEWKIIVPALRNIHMPTSKGADGTAMSCPSTKQVSNLETEFGPIFEDYARKNGLKLPLFPIAKYEVVTESSKVKKERELEKVEDLKENLEKDPEEESKGKQYKADEAPNPTFD
ncbi:hypothetical protein Gotur_020469 [Gossypium turneri]